MSVHGLRVAVAMACLLGLGAGCRSTAKAPEPAGLGASTGDEASGGWTYDRVTGRMQRTGGGDPSGDAPDDVTAASYLESTSREDLAAQARDFKPDVDDDDGLGLSDFYPSNVLAAAKEMAGYGPNEAVARALYNEGETLFRDGQYKEAAERFKDGVKRAPPSPLKEDCLFMLGES
ncbi:MAG: hypothetical protein ABIP48_27145, partial [Planctomycetota bacterium]